MFCILQVLLEFYLFALEELSGFLQSPRVIRIHQRIHPLGTMDISTKFHGDLSNSCQHFNESQKDQPHGGTRKVRGSPMSLGFIIWGPRISTNVITIYPDWYPIKIFSVWLTIIGICKWNCGLSKDVYIWFSVMNTGGDLIFNGIWMYKSAPWKIYSSTCSLLGYEDSTVSHRRQPKSTTTSYWSL